MEIPVSVTFQECLMSLFVRSRKMKTPEKDSFQDRFSPVHDKS